MNQFTESSNETVEDFPSFNLEPKTLADLQKEIFRWQEYNFGKQKDRRMVFGICEESGELCHAHLKLEQGIRGDKDDLIASARDAIGDICIYAFNLLSNNQERVPPIRPSQDVAMTDDLERIGNMVLIVFCAAAKVETARRAQAMSTPRPVHPTAPKVTPTMIRHTHELLMAVNSYCALVGWDLEEIIRETWREVGARDWKRFPKNGKSE